MTNVSFMLLQWNIQPEYSQGEHWQQGAKAESSGAWQACLSLYCNSYVGDLLKMQ